MCYKQRQLFPLGKVRKVFTCLRSEIGIGLFFLFVELWQHLHSRLIFSRRYSPMGYFPTLGVC